MNKETKKIITNLIYETYHKIVPKLLEIGKDEFMLNDIGIYFRYDKSIFKKSVIDKHCTCGEYRPSSLYINIYLDGILAFAHNLYTATASTRLDIELIAKTKLISTIIHELFHHNQKIDFTISDKKKQQEKAEAMVYQKELEFQIKYYDDLIHYLGCDAWFLLLNMSTDISGIDDIKSNIDRVLKDSIEEMFPNIGYTPYEYTDSCNFLARYIFASYYDRTFNKDIYNSSENILKSEEIYDHILKFIKNYDESLSVTLKFDIDLSEIFSGVKNPRVSGYVLLKDNGKDLNEVKSIERLFNVVINKINKTAKITRKQLLKLDNKSLYNKINPEYNWDRVGTYICRYYTIDYTINCGMMTLELRKLKTL